MTTSLDPRLTALGDELERACAADLAPKPRRLRVTRRVLLASAAAAVVLGGAAAFAADPALDQRTTSPGAFPQVPRR